jgi:tetratricopeptide (TPR) repeat protein
LRDSKNYSYIIVIFLIVASCIAFGRIAGNDFINFDDNGYITENNHVQSGINKESIKWAFTTVVLGNWHPLTLLSHMLDWKLFGANASGYHLVNLFLHIGAVIFLFLFLNKTTNNIWPAAFAAALFALHPLRVESVAWAAERKDVLSMFFGMASIYAYAIYVEKNKISQYFLCLLLFTLGLMSKPMLVTLPFILLLLDYWPLERWQKTLITPIETKPFNALESHKKKKKKRKAEELAKKKSNVFIRESKESKETIGRLFMEKTPFLFLAFVSSIVAIWAQNKGGAMSSLQKVQFAERLSNAFISYVAYLGKILWPVDLAFFYPYEKSLPGWEFVICAFLITMISAAMIRYLKKAAFLFVGWFWYLGTLVPVIGFIQVGGQSMADRYTYLPSVGIAIMLAWGIPSLIRSEDKRKKILFPAGIACLALLTILTWHQCGYWKSSITLFSHALKITKDNYVAHVNLGTALSDEGKIEDSINHYNEAIRIKPNLADAHYNKGFAYFKQDQYQRAIEDFNEAVRLKPNYISAYNNRGIAYFKLGRYRSAIEDYNKEIILKPDNAGAYKNRAVVYLIQGNKELGCYDAQKACTLGDCATLKAAQGMKYCR